MVNYICLSKLCTPDFERQGSGRIKPDADVRSVYDTEPIQFIIIILQCTRSTSDNQQRII